nr:uncharacterized protein LOC131765961 isoform X2 [Kogia breviceps]
MNNETSVFRCGNRVLFPGICQLQSKVVAISIIYTPWERLCHLWTGPFPREHRRGENGSCATNSQMAGLLAPKPDVILQLKRREEPWKLDFQEAEEKQVPGGTSLAAICDFEDISHA